MFYWSPELWNQAVDLAAAYWIVPVGLVALAFYGSYHFNTPDYALAAERAGSEDPPWTLHFQAARPRPSAVHHIANTVQAL